MPNKIIAILISLFAFIIATNAYAADKVLTVTGVESNQLQQVVGQPNNVPTLIVYNTSTCSNEFPKFKLFSALEPQTLAYNSFDRITPVNLATAQPSLGGYRLSGIIWFNNEFHAYGYQCTDGKILFLHSKDGKDWYINSDQKIQAMASSSYIKAMIGSGKSDSPALVAVGNSGQVYYQKLNLDDRWFPSDLSLNNSNMVFQLISYHHQFLLITTSIPVDDNSLPEQPHFYLSADGKSWKSITTPVGTLVGVFGATFSVGEDKLLAQALVNNKDTIVELSIDEANNVLTIQNEITTPKPAAMSDLKLENVIYSSATESYYFVFTDYDHQQNYWIKAKTLQEVAAANLQILNIENNNPYEISTSDDGLNYYLFMFNDKPYFLAGVNFNHYGYYDDTAIYNLVN